MSFFYLHLPIEISTTTQIPLQGYDSYVLCCYHLFVNINQAKKEHIKITEIIEYRLKVDADEDKFLKEAKNYFDYFNGTFKGFIDLELTKGDDKWINIVPWETMEDVRACGEVLRNSPQETAAYAAFTERASVNLTFLEQKIFFK